MRKCNYWTVTKWPRKWHISNHCLLRSGRSLRVHKVKNWVLKVMSRMSRDWKRAGYMLQAVCCWTTHCVWSWTQKCRTVLLIFVLNTLQVYKSQIATPAGARTGFDRAWGYLIQLFTVRVAGTVSVVATISLLPSYKNPHCTQLWGLNGWIAAGWTNDRHETSETERVWLPVLSQLNLNSLSFSFHDIFPSLDPHSSDLSCNQTLSKIF